MVYDRLCEERPTRSVREYLAILHLAATEGESAVDGALATRLARDERIDAGELRRSVSASDRPAITDVEIAAVDLTSYDGLLSEEALCPLS